MNENQPITLGELIDVLSQAGANNTVQFDFSCKAPGPVASYRGYYDHLALDPDGPSPVRVETMLQNLNDAVGSVFEGYKGGDFRMSRDTPIWVAAYGESGGTCVTGVTILTWGTVIINTGYCDDWSGGMQRARQVLFNGLGFGNV